MQDTDISNTERQNVLQSHCESRRARREPWFTSVYCPCSLHFLAGNNHHGNDFTVPRNPGHSSEDQHFLFCSGQTSLLTWGWLLADGHLEWNRNRNCKCRRGLFWMPKNPQSLCHAGFDSVPAFLAQQSSVPVSLQLALQTEVRKWLSGWVWLMVVSAAQAVHPCLEPEVSLLLVLCWILSALSAVGSCVYITQVFCSLLAVRFSLLKVP